VISGDVVALDVDSELAKVVSPVGRSEVRVLGHLAQALDIDIRHLDAYARCLVAIFPSDGVEPGFSGLLVFRTLDRRWKVLVDLYACSICDEVPSVFCSDFRTYRQGVANLANAAILSRFLFVGIVIRLVVSCRGESVAAFPLGTEVVKVSPFLAKTAA